MAGGQHLPRHLGMARHARGLKHRWLVGRNAEPFQALDDHLGRRFRAAFAVGVLDAEQEFAAVVTGEQVIEQRRSGAADVKQAGRAGREAGSNSHGTHVARAFTGCRGCVL